MNKAYLKTYVMNNLTFKQGQSEYFRVMESRIRYYAEKYDPHTVVYDHQQVQIEQEQPGEVKLKGFSILRSIFMNIF